MKTTRNITLDINRADVINVYEVHQGEACSREFALTLTDGSSIVDLSNNVTAKANATVNHVIVAIDEPLTIVNNKIILLLTENMQSLSGILKVDVTVFEGDEILTAATLRFRVSPAAIDGNSRFEPLYPTLQEMINAGIKPEAIAAAVNAYLDEHGAENLVYEALDLAFTGDPYIAPTLLVDNTIDATYNPNGHYILYYIDSDGGRHNLFDFSNYFAEKAAVPSKTSQLTNDSGFLTANAAAVNGNLPVEFMPHVGLINASDFSLYGVSSLGNYHAEIAVTPGEKYIINCRSVNSTYPGAFYTLSGVKVSAIFEDSGVTHLNAGITVPDGVDTLWLNNNRNQISLDEWKVYKILTSGKYTEENNDEIRTLNAERSDEAVESTRRLKNLESLFSFRWKPFDKAYYCFVNDGSKNWVNIFYDVFHAHGVPFCAATVGENIELQYDPQNNGRTIKETLDLIVADGGEVMVYLNAAALKSTDPFVLWYDYAVKNGKHLIESYGYKPRGLILSMNSARNSAVGQEICERFFDYADHVGTKPQYNIRRQQFSSSSTVADVKAYIDQTVTTPGFYPIMMHGTYMEPWASAEGMEEILSYIENNYPSTAAISTYSHVFDAFGTNGFLTLNDLPRYNGGVV